MHSGCSPTSEVNYKRPACSARVLLIDSDTLSKQYHTKNQTSDQRRKQALASISSIALRAYINLSFRIIRRTQEAVKLSEAIPGEIFSPHLHSLECLLNHVALSPSLITEVKYVES